MDAHGAGGCTTPHNHLLGRAWLQANSSSVGHRHRSISAAAKKKTPKGKTSINDEKLGTGAQPEDASLSDYYQFSRLLGEAPSDAEQRLVRKQRMSLGAPTDAGSSAYLQKWKKQLADEAANKRLAEAFFKKEGNPASAGAIASFQNAAKEAGMDLGSWLDADDDNRSADGVSLAGPPRRMPAAGAAPAATPPSGSLVRPQTGPGSLQRPRSPSVAALDDDNDLTDDEDESGSEDDNPPGPAPTAADFETLLAKPQGATRSTPRSSKGSRASAGGPAPRTRVRTRAPRTLEDLADEALRSRPARRSIDGGNPLTSLEEEELRKGMGVVGGKALLISGCA
ncbi:hypothetical protein WJX84_007889 [Apatococcus fuscideae]|uniref:Uncharacterized protein n=1 Tax=Apatococcus fuscideae TaxID=2026836 RepID=A0AAW1T968_9CHLO